MGNRAREEQVPAEPSPWAQPHTSDGCRTGHQSFPGKRKTKGTQKQEARMTKGQEKLSQEEKGNSRDCCLRRRQMRRDADKRL